MRYVKYYPDRDDQNEYPATTSVPPLSETAVVVGNEWWPIDEVWNLYRFFNEQDAYDFIEAASWHPEAAEGVNFNGNPYMGIPLRFVGETEVVGMRKYWIFRDVTDEVAAEYANQKYWYVEDPRTVPSIRGRVVEISI